MGDYIKFNTEQARRIVNAIREVERPNRSTDGGPYDNALNSRKIPNQDFTVRVYKTSGSAGSSITNCTWLYTVKTCSGRTLGTNMSPTKRRFPNTVYTVTPDGSFGTAFFDENGDLKLKDANELPDQESC